MPRFSWPGFCNPTPAAKAPRRKRVSVQPIPAVFIRFEDALYAPSQAGIPAKRVLDVAVAALALILLSPVLALTTLAILLDSKGPLVFCQRRIGLNGAPFAIYKFRSMHVLEDGAEVVQATEGDARITRVGRILRKLSIDELPQLFNVLKGEMSLVGPRPHAAAHDEFYGARITNYALRHRVKPGITGWAQINGARGATPQLADMQARIDLDAWYVVHHDLWLDLKILARTPLEVLICRNAA
jgi:putative colanic acid biosynthesis UDP-glucose lipid carrier transferase